MPRRSYAARLIYAVGVWLLGTGAGRKSLAATAGLLTMVSLVMCGESRSGEWKGLENHIAPNKGRFTLKGGRGTSVECSVQGETGYIVGDRWVFKGDAVVASSSCQGRVGLDGKVSAVLKLDMEWRGRIKGMGGDWEDIDGKAKCEGELTGTLASGGKWEGKCKRDDREWETSITWALAA